jgi:rhodanese-related sulfurtransferase
MKKLSLIFTVFILLATSFVVKGQITEKQKSVIYDVNVEQFNKLASSDKGIVLDVRTPEEWEEGVILNATKMNYYDDNFADQIDALDKNTPVFVYCKRGGRSSGAAKVLEEKGFTKVFNLLGGITAWKEQGLKIEK